MAKGKKANAVGIIIDAAQIRAVELSGSKKAPAVAAFGWVPMPEGLMRDGIITDISRAAELLDDLWKDSGFSDAPWIVGAKNQNVLMRLAAFPRAADDKMDNIIRFQAQQAIPIPVSELVLDYLLCDELTEDGRPMINALLVGAKQDFVQNVIALAKATRHTIGDIDVSLLAALRTATSLSVASEEVFLLADVDYETVSMLICRGRTVLMTRTVPLPPTFLEQAHKRRQLAVAMTGNSADSRLDNGEDGVLAEATRLLAGQLTEDIRASISFFSTQHSVNVEKIVLCGPMAALDDVAQQVAMEFYIPVEAPQPYQELLQVDPRYYANCVSLAIRGLGE